MIRRGGAKLGADSTPVFCQVIDLNKRRVHLDALLLYTTDCGRRGGYLTYPPGFKEQMNQVATTGLHHSYSRATDLK